MGLLGDIGGLVGGLVGGNKARQARKDQTAQYQQGLDYLRGVKEEAGPSAFQDVRVDPATRAAQMGALGMMQGEAAAGGLGVQDRAALQQAQDAQAQQERGQREAILQGAQRRNTGGVSANLGAQLAAQQGSAQRGAMVGTQVAADARNRALTAMAGAGALGGQVRGQDFGEQSSIAQAKDLISRFNAGQRLAKGGQVSGYHRAFGDMYGEQGREQLAQATGLGQQIGGVAGSVASKFPALSFLS